MDKIKDFIKRNFSSFSYFYKYLGYRIFVSIILSLALGVLDGFGLSMFLPLLQMVNNEASVDPETLGKLRFIVDGLEAMGLSMTLGIILAVMVFFFTFKGLAKYASFAYRVVVQQYFVRNLRLRMVKALSGMSYKHFINADVGRIQNTLSGEVERVSRAYNSYFGSMQQFILMLVYVGFAFFVDFKFAILVTVGGVLTNLLYRVIYSRTKKASRMLTKDSNFFQGLIIQYVSNFKYLKSTGSLEKYGSKLDSAIHEIENSNRRIGMLGAILQSAREPLMILVVATVIFIQTKMIGVSMGPILISLLFFYRALTALTTMQDRWNVFLSTSGSMENMTLFQEELAQQQEVQGKKQIGNFNKEMILHIEEFSYNSEKILHDLDLRISKNEVIAFVGESGSGKTTLMNILSGLLPLEHGYLEVDGIQLNELDRRTFQKRIGYITQEPVIFNDTIFNNVCFWDEPDKDNLMRFRAAIEQAALDKYVDGLPDGANTVLGSNGVNLSGGQKQRISIARELYKDIDFLFMDEATSALDSETERAIQENIEKLKGHYTIVIIAHRLSTVKNADRVVVMNKGRIEHTGSYQELLVNSPSFKRIVELQEL